MFEEEMEATDDEWVAMAMKNDAMVGEMLCRLRLPKAEAPRFSQAAAAAATALPMKWGVVRKRARPVAARADGWCDRDREGDAGRRAEVEAAGAKVASPTTPLSWSGGVGSTGSGDGSDSSSQPRVKADAVIQTAGGGGGSGSAGFGCAVRLKATAREANALRLPTKRPAKKKTIAVLKDEESKLLMERTNLENDIEKLMKAYSSLLQQNKRLKMIKSELPPKDVFDWKPDIVASGTSEQAPQEAVLPAEAADLDPVTPQSASDSKPGILTTGSAKPEVLDSALLTDSEQLSRTANATHQNHAARETCPASSVPGCGGAFFIPDLNLPLDVGFVGDAA